MISSNLLMIIIISSDGDLSVILKVSPEGGTLIIYRNKRFSTMNYLETEPRGIL